MSYRDKALGGFVFGVFAAAPMLAAQVDIPNTFSSGETASAASVNENFQALATAVDNLEQKFGDLDTQVTDNDSRLTTIEDSDLLAREDFVVDLDQYLEVHSTSPADTAVHGPILRLTGANFQVINAAQDQTTPDGTGNIVIGFAEARSFGGRLCSDGLYETQSECETNGEIWSYSHNSGSHNIVGGEEPAYAQTGGLVVGVRNGINKTGATITAGTKNIATGNYASVTGGRNNTASGSSAVVSGGDGNTASGFDASVSGGELNTADGEDSSISGGFSCEITSTNQWGAGSTEGCS